MIYNNFNWPQGDRINSIYQKDPTASYEILSFSHFDFIPIQLQFHFFIKDELVGGRLLIFQQLLSKKLIEHSWNWSKKMLYVKLKKIFSFGLEKEIITLIAFFF